MWNSFRVTENKCGMGRVIIQNTRGKENLRETLLRYAGMWQMITRMEKGDGWKLPSNCTKGDPFVWLQPAPEYMD